MFIENEQKNDLLSYNNAIDTKVTEATNNINRFPFLTASGNPQDAVQMFYEMATTGVCMAQIVTMVWALMLIVTSAIEKTGDNEEGNTDTNV